MKPNHLKLLQKARSLEISGRVAEAVNAYRAFLSREPEHVVAWSHYAEQLLALGQFEKAQEAFETSLAIEPEQPMARINLGSALMQQDRLDEAEGHFAAVLQADPKRMEARLFLVVCLLSRGDLDGAWTLLEGVNEPGRRGDVPALNPEHAELWARLGTALFERREFEKAERACAKALQLDPHHLSALAYLGSTRMEQGDLAGAEGLFRRLVAEHPQEDRARLLLVTCLGRRGDPGPACEAITEVLLRAPTSFLVHKSVMGPYYSLGRWEEYQAEIDRFRKVDPTASAYLDFEQSFVDLLFGNMRGGWERFEARLKIPIAWRPQRTFEQPAWTGETFAGKTLLLWPEQGLGDTLMALRYLPLVKARGGRVILETQPTLVAVAATRPGADTVISTEMPLPPFDLQASLMSLPWIFRTEPDSVPTEIPYLEVPKDVPHRQALCEALSQAREATRIGLVWAGGPGHARDSERSLPAGALAPLADLSGVAWFSLQVGRQDLPPLPNLVSLSPHLGDFSDTAYALRELDVLITVDTSVAHLAGALGVPTLLLLAHQPDYRWMLDRNDSPWYPTMRLHRQATYGDWEAVIRGVVEDLAQRIRAGARPQRRPAP